MLPSNITTSQTWLKMYEQDGWNGIICGIYLIRLIESTSWYHSLRKDEEKIIPNLDQTLVLGRIVLNLIPDKSPMFFLKRSKADNSVTYLGSMLNFLMLE